MPSPHTFEIAPIASLLDRRLHTCRVVVDPFAGRSRRGTLRNDLKDGGREALSWLRRLERESADALLFDPPYSPRQIVEVYKRVGLDVTMRTTQSSFFSRRKDEATEVIKKGGIVICCGWNSGGFGKSRGFQLLEVLLVAHGGAHNDTIVTVERKR